MKTRKYIQMGVEDYKAFVNSYLNARPDTSRIINELYFDDTLSISDWVMSIEGENLNSIRSSLKKQVPHSITTLDKIADVQMPDSFSSENLNNPSLFFSQRIYENVEDAKRLFPKPYYIFNLNYFTKIDSFIVSDLMSEFRSEIPDIIYQRNVSDSIIFKLIIDRKYTKHSGIVDYTFPDLILERNQEEYFLFRSSDVNSLLLLPISSSMFFYGESHIPIYDSNNNIIGMDRKQDEPVIYEDKDNKRFIVSNSYEKVVLYNKYIMLCVFLYVSLVKAFVNWTTKQPVDRWCDTN